MTKNFPFFHVPTSTLLLPFFSALLCVLTSHLPVLWLQVVLFPAFALEALEGILK
jgi:hypothetical protein